MAAPDKSFKVLIAGGGIAGLALANMLEKFEIDYLLLEAHSEIAPAVGASIGLFPNGLRILDQLDCYESLLEHMDGSGQDLYIQDKNGNSVVGILGIQKHLLHRHGYPLLFFNRQWLLQDLYDHLQNKDRVLLNHRVQQIDLVEGGIEVTTASGRKIFGSLIVGADGLHSAVRQEMHRIGNELEPGYFPPDESDRVPCHYMCSFGIAQNVPGWVETDQYTVIGKGHSQLVVSGPQNQVYWFFFSKLPETKYGQDIPRHSKELEAQFIDKYGHVPITRKVTFGQVYAKRLSSTLTPLHEFVYKKWFVNRILIFGDSAHKPNPIGGQGGNGAIESAAEFVNALLRKKDDRAGSLAGLTDEEVKSVFEEMQAARHQRAEQIVAGSHAQQALAAYEKPLVSTLIWDWLTPSMGNESAMVRFARTLKGGAKLERLTIKSRPRAIPFDDELPARPLNNMLPFQIVFIGVMGYLVVMAFKAWRGPRSTLDICEATRTNGLCVADVPAFDRAMSQQVSAFFIPKKAPEHTVPILYLSSQLIAPILIYIIEGYRLGNNGTILALPSLHLVAMQLMGVGTIAPIYAILNACFSYHLPPGRFVRLEVASALMPALTLGYVLPTVLLTLLSPNSESWHTWASVWQWLPLLVCILIYVHASVVGLWRQSRMTHQEKRESEFDRYRCPDVPTLKLTYSYAFIIQAIAHLTLLTYAHRHSQSFSAYKIIDLLSSRYPDWNIDNVGSQIMVLVKYDMLLAAAAWVASSMYSIWNLRRLGYINTWDAFISMLAVIAGQVLVGPGATWVGLWYWREGILSGLKRE